MQNVAIRPFVPGDSANAVRILRDPRVSKTYMLPDLSEEAALKLFNRLMELSDDSTHFVRAVSADGRMVGWLNDTEIADDTMELGWVIDPQYQNKGYATAAVKLALTQLRTAGIRAVTAGAFSENAASIRVMEKVGMKRMGQTDEIDYRGENHKCVYYCVDL